MGAKYRSVNSTGTPFELGKMTTPFDPPAIAQLPGVIAEVTALSKPPRPPRPVRRAADPRHEVTGRTWLR
jgi:hypothetical protein